ncbi:heme oxygenase (biliverdin-producing) [Stackebrandtia soli]|uniref:biliverdin-producing heme oxygenase n=1 Tax=Stackebrandtia soli TaxID=1892856 RepID=UPI0039EC7535
MTLEAPAKPFSVMLREATWARHEGIASTEDTPAEETPEKGILGSLFDGELHLDDFTAWTAQQYFVYDVIESAAEHWHGHAVAGPFVLDDMTRRTALETDLATLVGADWRETISPLASTTRYLDRLREVCFDWPGGFVAHQYTRYLGDMSGGQAFRQAANDLYGFADGPGVGFYVFDRIADLTAFKSDYRALLDNAPWDDEERQRIIAEVLDAYDYNEGFLTELARGMRRSV